MNTIEMRKEFKKYVSQLFSENLILATDLLVFLTSKGERGAIENLLNIEELRLNFIKVQKSVAQEKLTSIEQLL